MKEDFEKIKKLLDDHKIKYEFMEHEPVYTSEDAARVRGIDIRTGAKSMIIRSDGKFYNFVLSAVNKIEWKKVKTLLGSASASFANPEEVKEVVHCEVGSVPPFGNLYGLKVYCDPYLLENEYIDFNPGLHTFSIKMKSEDWFKVVNPEVVDFCK